MGAESIPRASFPLTSGRKTRILGATISGMRIDADCTVNRITRIRLFPLLFQNGCSQSSHFLTAGQGERSSGNEIGRELDNKSSLHSLQAYDNILLDSGLKGLGHAILGNLV